MTALHSILVTSQLSMFQILILANMKHSIRDIEENSITVQTEDEDVSLQVCLAIHAMMKKAVYRFEILLHLCLKKLAQL